MTKEEKQLLLIDLCARLPYGVKVQCITKSARIAGALPLTETLNTVLYGYVKEDNIELKPYLRPLSSMTEEEINEFILISDTVLCVGDKRSTCILSLEQMDWLNKKMFDYRGLIEKGLALEAPEEMYKTE